MLGSDRRPLLTRLRAKAQSFARSYGITYPIVRDRDGSTLKSFQVLGYPETLVIDREGRIAATRRYPVDEHFLEQSVLPLLAPALHRHLRELPSALNGLSLTEELALTLLAAQPQTLNTMFATMSSSADPLPGQGDWNVRRRVVDMEAARAPVFSRSPGLDRDGNARPPWTDVFAITELGRSVLRGEVDFRSLDPPPRWVGGAEIAPGNTDWRWDERRRDVVHR